MFLKSAHRLRGKTNLNDKLLPADWLEDLLQIKANSPLIGLLKGQLKLWLADTEGGREGEIKRMRSKSQSTVWELAGGVGGSVRKAFAKKRVGMVSRRGGHFFTLLRSTRRSLLLWWRASCRPRRSWTARERGTPSERGSKREKSSWNSYLTCRMNLEYSLFYFYQQNSRKRTKNQHNSLLICLLNIGELQTDNCFCWQ